METLNNLIRIMPAKGNESFLTLTDFIKPFLLLGETVFLWIDGSFLSLSCDRFDSVPGDEAPFPALRKSLLCHLKNRRKL
jgi:hypothetical protein